MIKNSIRKLLFMTVFLSILLSSSAYASFIPRVHAAEQTTPEKSLMVLSDVAGFNVTAYTATLKAQQQDRFMSLPQEETDFVLTSNQGKLRARCSFVNDHLRQIFINDLNGSPSLNQPATDALGNAKGFLERYQGYTGVSFYGELKSMLDNVNVGENVTKTAGNVKLTVSVINKAFVDFKWTYVDAHGVPAMSKTVVLSYRDGFLKCFLDNWELYKIGSKPKLSSEEAVAIALNASKDVSWKVVNTDNSTTVASSFKVASIGNTTLSYLNYGEVSSARSGDPFTLYPSWYVPLGFDKVYPGGLTGAYVRVWADTGEVSGISPMIFGVDAVEQPLVMQDPQLMFFAVPSAIILALCLAWAILDKRRRASCAKLKTIRIGLHRIGCLMLCLLILSGGVLIIVPSAKAIPANYDAKSMIYASLYGQLEGEVEAFEEVCGEVYNYFYDSGYSVSNEIGEHTIKQFILDNASLMEDNFDCVALLHIGHMAGACAYLDNDGETVAYYDVYPETDQSEHFFVFIWACRSADYINLAQAWTHNNNLGSDGYFNPDSGSQCYIGFYAASPALSGDSFKDYPVLGKDVITEFYYYALDEDYSVNDALDLTSLELFSTGFGYSPLCGYETWWPYNPLFPEMEEGWFQGAMQVFGNGNIYLVKEYEVTVLAKDQSGNNLGSLNVYIDGQNVGATGSSLLVTEATHSFHVSPPLFYWFLNYTYNGGSSTSDPMALNVSSDMTVTAYFGEASYWLTVDAIELYYNGYVPAGVSIDSGQWTGVAGDSFYVPAGYHYVEVDQYVYGEVTYEFYFISGYDFFENPVYVMVNSDTEYTAVYMPT